MKAMVNEKGVPQEGLPLEEVALSAALYQNELVFIRVLLEAAKIKPVIDRWYLLSEAAEALRTTNKSAPEEKRSFLLNKKAGDNL
jgi:hypothetical protein